MGSKSKMIGARSRMFGISKRNTPNGGAFGSKRFKAYQTVIEIKDKVSRRTGFAKKEVLLSVRSKGAVYLRGANTRSHEVQV